MHVTIPTTLKTAALDELEANHRRRTPSPHVSDATIRAGAEYLLIRVLGMIVEQLERNPPQQTATTNDFARLVRKEFSPRTQASMQESIRRINESRQRSLDLLKQSQRAGLIQLLTMDNGVSQTTAEKIVDHLINQVR